jgi:hypothetical protein
MREVKRLDVDGGDEGCIGRNPCMTIDDLGRFACSGARKRRVRVADLPMPHVNASVVGPMSSPTGPTAFPPQLPRDAHDI